MIYNTLYMFYYTDTQPRDVSKSLPDEVMLHSPHIATNRESQSDLTLPTLPC